MSKFQNGLVGGMRGMPMGGSGTSKRNLSRKLGGETTLIPGHGVFAYKGEENLCGNALADTNTLTLSKDMVAGDVLTITLSDGQTFVQAFETDVATTYAAMLAKLNDGSNITATYATLVFTITQKFYAIVIVGTCAGDTPPTIAIGGTPTKSSLQYCLGCALRSANVIVSGTDEIPVDTMVSISNMGMTIVEVNDVDKCIAGTAVKVSTLVADKGLFVDTSVSTNVSVIPNAFYDGVVPNSEKLVIVQFVGGVV